MPLDPGTLRAGDAPAGTAGAPECDLDRPSPAGGTARRLAQGAGPIGSGTEACAAPASSTDTEAKLRYLQAALRAQAGEPVQRLETHMSWLLLGADRVL